MSTEQSKNFPTQKILVVLVIAALVSAGIFYFKSYRFNNQREYVASLFKDPDSTVFKNEFLSSNGLYCADVNAKNSYGAYGGFTRVLYDGACNILIQDEPNEGVDTSNCTKPANLEVGRFSTTAIMWKLEAMKEAEGYTNFDRKVVSNWREKFNTLWDKSCH